MNKKNIKQCKHMNTNFSILYSYFIKNTTHLGHSSIKLQKSWHNSLNKCFYGTRNKTIIFNFKLTLNYLIKALYVFTVIIKSNGKVFIVNTNPELSKLIYYIRKNTNSCSLFFSDCGWTKGTLTNWSEVSNKVKTFIAFHHDFNTFLNENNIHFPNYKKMKKNYKGFLNTTKNNDNEKKNTILKFHLKWKPDLIILLSSENTDSIIKEACCLNIPTIALLDSNFNASKITYPIPTNTYSYCFVWFFSALITKLANKYCCN